MPRHKSISQRIKAARASELKKEIALDWAGAWEKEQLELLSSIKYAIDAADYNQLHFALDQLGAVSEKKFAALPKVINLIAGESNK